MIYDLTPSRKPSSPKVIWGRRALTALDELGSAERTQVANSVFAVAGSSGNGGGRRPDVQRVKSGRGLWILRASERVRVLYRYLEDEQVEIVDVLARDSSRRFTELY